VTARIHIDAGTMFEHLTVIGPTRNAKGVAAYECRCTCGATAVVRGSDLRSGHNRSCGCMGVKLRAAANTVHGHAVRGSESPEYKSWKSVVQRCENPSDPRFASYGGRGVRMCARWRKSFDMFLKDMGQRPDGCSLDRLDVDRGYGPNNCRWATRIEQANNTRRSVRFEFRGFSGTVRQLSEKFGVPHRVLKRRVAAGWGVELAIDTARDESRSLIRAAEREEP
jgi:hypothetical protein